MGHRPLCGLASALVGGAVAHTKPLPSFTHGQHYTMIMGNLLRCYKLGKFIISHGYSYPIQINYIYFTHNTIVGCDMSTWVICSNWIIDDYWSFLGVTLWGHQFCCKWWWRLGDGCEKCHEQFNPWSTRIPWWWICWILAPVRGFITREMGTSHFIFDGWIYIFDA